MADVPEGTEDDWGTQGRSDGYVTADLAITGWLDSTLLWGPSQLGSHLPEHVGVTTPVSKNWNI